MEDKIMQGKITEGARFALNRMFRDMTAWGLPWYVHWEVAQEQCDSDDINDQLQFLEGFSTKREIISINSALRKWGFDVQLQFQWYEKSD